MSDKDYSNPYEDDDDKEEALIKPLKIDKAESLIWQDDFEIREYNQKHGFVT